VRELTIVLAYYINAGMLARQYETFLALPETLRAHLKLIVVDDGSPRDPATPADIGMPLEIYRIGVDVRWNQDAARNLGVDRSDTRWLLLTDIDHLIPQKTLETVVYTGMDSRVVYRFSRVSAPEMAPYKPHPNSWLMTRKMYDAIGGYDERLAGYYGSDADFRNRAQAAARQVVTLPDVLIRVPREVIPDASTTTYGRKEHQDKVNIPRILGERSMIPNWRPRRLTFPWTRVH
jgi:hypothetical protein